MFKLWCPKEAPTRNGKKVVVRIYFEDTGAYIWRKSVKHSLEIKDGSYGAEQSIRGLLELYGIDLDTVETRRDLACMLRDNDLLNRGYSSYDIPNNVQKPINKARDSININDSDPIVKKKPEQKSSNSNVIQLSDYFKKPK
jgi:hypothetical protein